METIAKAPPSHTPAVTLIIPAYNEERWLPVCLEALVAGTTERSRYEVFVVDKGSTDRTAEIADEYADEVLTIGGENVPIIRNQAAERARAPVLAFLDSDCIPAPNWLEAGLRSIQGESCVVGNTYSLPEDPAWTERDWESLEARLGIPGIDRSLENEGELRSGRQSLGPPRVVSA